MSLDILLCLLWPWFEDFWGLFWVHLGPETLKNQLKLEFRTILSNNPTSNIENWCQFEIWQNFSLLLLLYTGSADGARRACAKGRATRNDAVTRCVVCTATFWSDAVSSRKCYLPPPPFIASELPIIGKRQSGAF